MKLLINIATTLINTLKVSYKSSLKRKKIITLLFKYIFIPIILHTNIFITKNKLLEWVNQ